MCDPYINDRLQKNFDLFKASQAFIYKSDAVSTNAVCIQFVCVYALRSNLRVFSHVGTIFCLPIFEQY